MWAIRDTLLKMWKVEVKPPLLCGQKLVVEPKALSQHTHIATYLLDPIIGVKSNRLVSSSSFPDSEPGKCSAIPAGTPLSSKLEVWRDDQLRQVPVLPAHTHRFHSIFASPASHSSSFPRFLLFGSSTRYINDSLTRKHSQFSQLL